MVKIEYIATKIIEQQLLLSRSVLSVAVAKSTPHSEMRKKSIRDRQATSVHIVIMDLRYSRVIAYIHDHHLNSIIN
jgi:hypothetical protein